MGAVRRQLYSLLDCRLGVLGDRGVGKTALIKRFMGEEYSKVGQPS